MGFKDIKYDIPVAHGTWQLACPPIQLVPNSAGPQIQDNFFTKRLWVLWGPFLALSEALLVGLFSHIPINSKTFFRLSLVFVTGIPKESCC